MSDKGNSQFTIDNAQFTMENDAKPLIPNS